MSETPSYQISPKFIFKFNYWSAILEPPFLISIIYLFSVQIRNQHLQKPTITVRIPVIVKIITKV